MVERTRGTPFYLDDFARTSLTDVLEFRPTRAWAIGAEAMVRVRPAGRFWGWAALTLARSLREDPDYGLIPSDYDAPVTLTLVGAYDLPKNWGLSGRVQITSGYPFTPEAQVLEPNRGFFSVGLPQAPNSERFPVYRRVDVRVDKTWTSNRARWTLFLDIQNLLNSRNPLLATYTPLYDDLLTQVYIPTIPNLGLEVKF